MYNHFVNFLLNVSFILDINRNKRMEIIAANENSIVTDFFEKFRVLLLKKYIYMNDSVPGKYDAFIRNCNKDFMVYMVSAIEKNEEHNEDDTQATDSGRATCTSSEQSRIKKKAPQTPDSTKSENSSMICKSTSKNKLPVKASKSNENEEKRKVIKKQHSLFSFKTKDQQAENKKGYDIFKKFMGFQKSKTNETSLDELYIREHTYGTKDVSKSQMMEIVKSNIPSSIVNEVNPYIDFTMAEALRTMVELNNKLQDSEIFIKEVLIKYIQNNSLENDLIASVNGHGKLLLESERRALNLTSETWLQQSEIYKDQQRSLQSTLNAVVHQNRELQEENEMLCKKNEKMCAKVITLQDASFLGKAENLSAVKVIEDLNRNNDKLRLKVNGLLAQMEDLEQTIKKHQKKTEFYQKQSNIANLQLQNTKALLQRTKADQEIEIAMLSCELQNNRITIKESVEAGDVLLDDLDLLKGQMKHVLRTINWDKLKRRGKSLVDVIHLCRSCINELARELSGKENEISLHIQENNSLRINIEENQACIINYREENLVLHEGVAKCKEYELEIGKQKGQLKECAEKMAMATQYIEMRGYELKAKDISIKEYEEHVQKLNTIIVEKSEALTRLQANMDKVAKDKETYMAQINGMAQVLTATGAGDIAKELATVQEKLTQMQTQYFSENSEKMDLMKRVENSKSELQTLTDTVKQNEKRIGELKKQNEILEKACEGFKEQTNTDKGTISVLQTERMRHLEEKNIIMAIYEKLKFELEKLERLEGEVCTVNKKASQLAMIAKYNKKLGEELKNQVAERDQTINKLQMNVRLLNENQMESVKEKQALCNELTQVFGVKTLLDSQLVKEQRRCMKLDESKKELQNVANLQLIGIKDMYQREHIALQGVLRDIKKLVRERDELVEKNTALEKKISKLSKENEKALMVIKEARVRLQERETLVFNCKQQISEKYTEIETLKNNFEDKVSHCKQGEELMKELLETMKKDNNVMKSNVEKLENELTEFKECLKEARDAKLNANNLNAKLRTEFNELTIRYEENMEKIQDLSQEKEYLCSTNQELSISLQNLFDERQSLQTTIKTFEVALQQNLEANEAFLNDISVRDEEIIVLQDRIRELEYTCGEFESNIKLINARNEKLANINVTLQTQVRVLEQENGKLIEQANTLENNVIQKYEQSLLGQDSELQCKYLDEQKSNEELDNLKQTLSAYEKNLGDMEKRKADLEKAHRTMAMKLLKAVQLLIFEKTSRQKAMADCQMAEEKSKHLFQDNERLAVILEESREEVQKLKKATEDFNKEKDKLINLLESTEKRRDEELEENKNATELRSENEAQILERLKNLKKELNENHEELIRVQNSLSCSQSTCACLEFEKSEIILRCHELQCKLNAEELENEDLKISRQRALKLLQDLNTKGVLSKTTYEAILADEDVQNVDET